MVPAKTPYKPHINASSFLVFPAFGAWKFCPYIIFQPQFRVYF